MPLAAKKKHLWQSPVAISLLALALRLVATGFFYHRTYDSYENHLFFGFETGRIAELHRRGTWLWQSHVRRNGPTAWRTPNLDPGSLGHEISAREARFSPGCALFESNSFPQGCSFYGCNFFPGGLAKQRANYLHAPIFLNALVVSMRISI
jgi:hypothetical protein